jgi:hypothetical protein
LEQLHYYFYSFDNDVAGVLEELEENESAQQASESKIGLKISKKNTKKMDSIHLTKLKQTKKKMLLSSQQFKAKSFFKKKKEISEDKYRIITPLHIAHSNGNNRSINILLSFMAKIDSNNSASIKDILFELVEYQQFIPYMESLQFQTIQMINKQTLKVAEKFNDKIVAINSHTSSYVDNAFYRDKFGENQQQKDFEINLQMFEKTEYKNYPVSNWAFRIDWILTHDDGKKLL